MAYSRWTECPCWIIGTDEGFWCCSCTVKPAGESTVFATVAELKGHLDEHAAVEEFPRHVYERILRDAERDTGRKEP